MNVDLRLEKKLQDVIKVHGKLIIATDFDDTIFPFSVDEDDPLLVRVRHVLRKASQQGHTIVCYTARDDTNKDFVEDYFLKNSINLDSYNKEVLTLEGLGGKLFYNVFLEDKTALEVTLNTLASVLD